MSSADLKKSILWRESHQVMTNKSHGLYGLILFAIEHTILKFISSNRTNNFSLPQQSVCVKSISFFTLRVKRSNSAAASDRIAVLSLISTVPFSERGEAAAFGLLPPGDPAFLFNSELKKFAKTPSPPGAPAFNLPSICEKENHSESSFVETF